MAFTRIPSPYFKASSVASQSVKLLTAAFAAEYPGTRVMDCMAAMDDILIILPDFCWAITLPKTRLGYTVPFIFSCVTLSQSLICISKKLCSGANVAPGIFPPAIFNKISILPHFSRIF